MAKKGKIKNGRNKAKHSKLLNQKKAKIREEKLLNKQRLKAIVGKKNLLEQPCFCGTQHSYETCCYTIHKDITKAITAEQLMRSRYSAYVVADIDYLMKSHHGSTRPINERDEILNWTKAVEWLRLEVLNSSNGQDNDHEGAVEFKAYFIEQGVVSVIHENSKFIREDQNWSYLGEV
ncbi:MAG: YchJ family protein [Flavobacteriaceae bacterium]